MATGRRYVGRMQISDVVALVTGGAAGLGEATTRTLVAGGGRVMIREGEKEEGEGGGGEGGRGGGGQKRAAQRKWGGGEEGRGRGVGKEKGGRKRGVAIWVHALLALYGT